MHYRVGLNMLLEICREFHVASCLSACLAILVEGSARGTKLV